MQIHVSVHLQQSLKMHQDKRTSKRIEINYSRRRWLKMAMAFSVAVFPLGVVGGDKKLFEKLFGRVKNKAAYHLERGYNALGQGVGHYEEAVFEFTKAISIDSASVDAYYGRGIAHSYLTNYESAIADFDQTLNLDPRHDGALYQRNQVISAQRHAELEELLSLKSTKETQIPPGEASELINKFISSSRTINKYRSILIIRDFGCRELENYEHEIIRWHLDYASPNSFDVFQDTRLENFPSGAADKWVTLDHNRYELLANYEIKSLVPGRNEIEAFLKIDKYSALIESAHSGHIKVYRHPNEGWLFMKYNFGPDIVLGGWSITDFRKKLARSLNHVIGHVDEDGSVQFASIPTISDQVEPNSIGRNPDMQISKNNFQGHLLLWINPSTFKVVKAHIKVAGQLQNGEAVSLGIDQVFDDFGGDIKIMRPKGYISIS